MLERLHIVDFALARDVTIELAPGFNVFTGETGAGKSLVVDALAFLLGARRGREVIAAGAERATVSAALVIGGTRSTLERSVSLAGRSSSRIDGAPVSVEEVRLRFGDLVEIHGQSEQLAVLRPAVQLLMLDAFAGLTEQRNAVAAIVRDLRETRRRLDSLSHDARERERLTDQLRFELEEIRAADLVPGEDAALRAEQRRLANTTRLLEQAALAMDALESIPAGEVARALGDIAARDVSAAVLLDAATGLESTVTDLIRELRHYRDTIEDDPDRLSVVEERLDRIARLCRKYGETVDDVLGYAAGAESRLASLTDASQTIEGLQERESALLATLARAATSLSLARRQRAGDLVRSIAAELEQLRMSGAALAVGFGCDDDPGGPLVALPEYEVVITERESPVPCEPRPCAFSETGVDRVEFLASFNPGESPGPLSAVASGGEVSRFLLALASVVGGGGPARLFVFDEVDEGVGGRAGGIVGEALARLARQRQVLCVTHLPQVAAHGDRHFVVSKESDGQRTRTYVRCVEADDRREELAAMLGAPTDANRAAANDLLAHTRQD